MTPHQDSGGNFSPPFLLATPSSLSSRTLEGLFELTRRPSNALDWLCALLLELQRNKDIVRCATLRRESPSTPPTTADANLDFYERTFLHQSLFVKSQQNRIELVTRPGRQWNGRRWNGRQRNGRQWNGRGRWDGRFQWRFLSSSFPNINDLLAITPKVRRPCTHQSKSFSSLQ